jgi:hypothetical protein
MSLRTSFELLRDFQSHPGCHLTFAPRALPLSQKAGSVFFAQEQNPSGPAQAPF